MSYNPNISKILEMSTIVDQAKNYIQSDLDLIRLSEIQIERLRQLNYNSLVSTMRGSINSSVSQLIGGYTPKKLIGIPKSSEEARSRILNDALVRLAGTTFSRAVGPIEELPFHQLQDSVRRKIILSRTQIGAEHRLIAKYMQHRYNVWTRGDVEYKTTNESRLPILKYDDVRNSNIYGKDNSEQYSRLSGINNEKFGYPDKGFPFYILNLANNVKEIFPAFIRSLNESITINWNSSSFINRSEDIHIYQNADRSFTLDFMLFATSNGESIPVKLDDIEKNIGYPMYPIAINNEVDSIDFMTKEDMWRKINFLHQCSRPLYVDNVFSRAPYCILTIGHLLQDMITIIDSINLNYDPLIWDLNLDKHNNAKFSGIKPMIVGVTLTGKLLHKISPSATYQFYRGRVIGNA